MRRSIYIFNSGDLRRKDNTIVFHGEQGRKFIPVENIREIFIFGEVSINKRLLDFLSQREILLHFFNYYGYYSGTFYPREHYNSGYMILRQALCYADVGSRLELAKKFILGAIENILKVLVYYKNRGRSLGEVIERIEVLRDQVGGLSEVDQLMAIEGNVREYYFRCFDEILGDPDFIFEQRTRRPPKNRLNALISFGNSLLYVTVLSQIYKTHLDPRIGFLHATNFRRFTLNLDIAEIFKPIIVDRVIFSLINKRMLQKKHFEKKLDRVILNEKGRQIFIDKYEERLKASIDHPRLRRKVSYRELIRLEVYKVQKHLMGDEEYEPFIARW